MHSGAQHSDVLWTPHSGVQSLVRDLNHAYRKVAALYLVIEAVGGGLLLIAR